MDVGPVHKIYRCTAPGLPMAAYDGFSAFKPYLVDVGLLRRLAQLASTAWKKADPALGSIKKTDDLQLKAERAKQNPNDLSGVLCKEFNIRETVKTAWRSFGAINNTETFALEQLRGAYCIGGVDLSITIDLTCASLLFMRRDSDRKCIVQKYFLPTDRLQERVQQDKIPYDKWFERGLLRLCTGNSINYSDVTQWFVEIIKEYDLFPAWIYYDSYSARYFVEEMQMQGFTMVRCIQGAKTLSLPMQMLGADLQAHKVNYNNNPILKWCLTNTGVQTDRNGNIVPIKNQSPGSALTEPPPCRTAMWSCMNTTANTPASHKGVSA